jgi:hypothetical protein
VSITASGLYGLTLEKFLNVTSLPANGLESETATKGALILDAETPDFNADNFFDDVVANEASGTGYTADGAVLTGTEITISGGVLTYDANDSAWPSSTIANAMAECIYFDRGGAQSADELFALSDFVTAASSSGGTFTIQRSASGIVTVDFTP